MFQTCPPSRSSMRVLCAVSPWVDTRALEDKYPEQHPLPPALALYRDLLSACDRGQTLGICLLLSSLKTPQPQLQPWPSLDLSTTLSVVAGTWRKNFPAYLHCDGQEPGTTLNLVWVAQSKTPHAHLRFFLEFSISTGVSALRSHYRANGGLL